MNWPVFNNSVHHMYIMCTTIIRDCTTYVHRLVHYMYKDLYNYKKILYKGSLQRSFKKIL